MNDLNIINGVIVRPEGTFRGAISIKEGKISAVCAGDALPGAAVRTIDAEGMLVFPGMIDTHVHIRGGRLSHREDFLSGTRAAAAGGVTTLLEMPVAIPPASTAEAFLGRVKEASSAAYVDFCMYGGAGRDNGEEIARLAECGAVGFKTFLMPPVPGREKEFFGLCSETYEELEDVMRKVAQTGLPLAIHCENNEIVTCETKKLMEAGENGLAAFCRSRPAEAEAAAVSQVISAAQSTGCTVVVCHVSTVKAAQMVLKAKAAGVAIHLETCPHYLLFDCDGAEKLGVFARIKPPLRDKENAEGLLELYKEGALEFTGSDHAPYLKNEKQKGGGDIWNTFDGLPGIELSLPLLLNAVNEGRLTYEAVAGNFSENSARVLGLYPKKGRITEGADADLVLVRKDGVDDKVDISRLFTKARESAVIYEGTKLTHRVECTIVRGVVVYRGGKITGETGYGKFVRPIF